nr:xylose isomerase [Alphaproteobacteria bacterium]
RRATRLGADCGVSTANALVCSVDMARGVPQNGRETDKFPNSVPEIASALYIILRAGGIGTGGLNFDAKLRRQSTDPDDLFHAHVGAMDVCARGLTIAARMLEDGKLQDVVDARYSGWNGELGQNILAEKLSIADLESHVLLKNIDPQPRSGRQEMVENLANRYL